MIVILIRKRPDGLFERVLPDGRVDLFTLTDESDEGELGAGLTATVAVRTESGAAFSGARRLDG